jgi:hypothetical protein
MGLNRDKFRTTWGLRIFPSAKKYKIRPVLPVEGFDTETKRGYARILADSKEWIEVNNIHDVLEFLTRKHLRERCNVFFNMRFDFEVLMKHNKKLLQDLCINLKHGEYEDYIINYVPSKSFSIRHGNHSTIFYDISQFYNSTLEYATAKYLGQPCHELKGDRARLFDLHPIGKIGKYCQDDADKARQLGEFMLSTFSRMGVMPRKLYSCGYVSQLYTVNHANIPNFSSIPRIVQEMYWRSYRGGWFDTYKRGTFKATSYDLKSAYPWALSQIPDPTGGEWKHWTERKDLLEFPAGVFKCAIRGMKDGNPCAISSNLRNIYPVFDKYTLMYLTLGELIHLKDFYNIRILDGFYLDGDNGVRPYESLVRDLFAIKEGASEDIGLYDTVKKIINSLYGKTAQINRGKIPTAGRLFNPYFASECTARCRIRIHESIKDQLDKVISVMTDGMLLREGVKINTGNKLGDFEEKFRNKNTVIVETGVYEPEGLNIKTRGFTRKKIRFDEKGNPYVAVNKEGKPETVSLFDLLNTKATKIKVYHFRPRHFQECIVQNKKVGFERIGVFEAVERELNLNADIKRLWPCRVRGKDLLDNEYDSQPVPASVFMRV